MGGSHKGQLILVVIIVNHPLPEKSVSPYMSGSKGHEFRKKASPFSDENALARRFFGHHVGIPVAKLVPRKNARPPRQGSKLSRNL